MTGDATISTQGRYSATAIALHWSIAALVLSTIPIGWYGATFEGDLAQSATNLHKTIGILILALTLVRIGWRLTHRPPPLSASYARSLRWMARTAHVLFYVLLVVMPLSGWWMSSAVPNRHEFGLGTLHVPFLPVPRGFASAGPAHAMHVNLAWVMVGLVVLHVLAALRHQFIDKDDVLSRMLPRRDALSNQDAH
ncbi:MAG: cytochrome b [Pseudomonadota bacterium]